MAYGDVRNWHFSAAVAPEGDVSCRRGTRPVASLPKSSQFDPEQTNASKRGIKAFHETGRRIRKCWWRQIDLGSAIGRDYRVAALRRRQTAVAGRWRGGAS